MPELQQSPAIQYVKNSLNSGELSPELAARYDLPRYQSGCHQLLNMIPMTTGGITKRPSLRHVCYLGEEAGYRTRHSRLIPFVYSADLQFMLVVSYSYQSGSCDLYWINRDGTGSLGHLLTLPYKEHEIFELSYTQCGKVIYIAHHNHRPAKLYCVGITGGAPAFLYKMLDFTIKTPRPSCSVRAWGIWNQSAAISDQAYVVTAIDPKTGEESLPSEAAIHVTADPNYNWKVAVKVNKLDGINEYRVYKKRGGSYGYVGRVVDDVEEFVDNGVTPDIADPPPRNPENTFTQKGDYPSIVFMHQQRLGWAASDNDPLTIWMSQTSNFECRATKQPPSDDDAIEATLASTEANAILWAVPDRTGLAIGTEGGEWYLTGADGSGAVTPNSLSFQPQTTYGSQKYIPPVRCGASLIFCQRGGKHARDLGYSFQADRYQASDLTLLAHHLFRYTSIKSWAWQGAPDCTLWITTEAGQLLGLTYMPDQEITAWHRHETYLGEFHSVATLDDSEDRSRLWTITLRNIGGSYRYCLEMMDPRYEGLPTEYDYNATGSVPVFRDGPQLMAYKARCVPMLPDINGGTDTTFLKVKKINAVKARVIHSAPFHAQVHSQDMQSGAIMPVPIRGKPGYVDMADWACPLGGGWREGSRLELILDGTQPVTILGLVITMDVSPEGGGQ